MGDNCAANLEISWNRQGVLETAPVTGANGRRDPTYPSCMRPGLTAKLFLAILAVAVFAVLAMGIAARVSFDRGFLGYLSQQETERMESVAATLATAYREHGSWDFLRDNPRAWFRLMRPGHFAGAPPPGDFDAPFDQPPPHDRRQPPFERGNEAMPPGPHGPPSDGGDGQPFSMADLTGANFRFALLDAQGQLLFGNPGTVNGAHSLKRTITVGGRAVGTLMMLPLRDVTAAGDVRFQSGQYRATWTIGIVALLLAALLAIWLARTLLVPVHRIAKATHALAKGDYGSRVETHTHDELGQLARDFNHLATVLESNERTRKQFVADISHELRTPLAIIRGELEALEDGVRHFDADAIKSLHAEVGVLSKLIDDLYQLSLADVGAMVYRKEDMDLRKLLQDTVELFHERLRKVDVLLELKLPAAPVIVAADKDRLHQLFSNLIENSARYTHAGGVLRIACRSDTRNAIVDVMDSSPGVDTAHLPRLFDRFFRGEASRNRASGGAGLGLAVCRAIVEAHGGSMTAQPSPLGGLWLSIHLPTGKT